MTDRRALGRRLGDDVAMPSEGDITEIPNPELLERLDLLLLELEQRLLRYARSGHEIQQMADEGLLLAVRAAARLAQAQSSAAHTAGHLQVVGVGTWSPTSTQPAWSDDARVTEGPAQDDPEG
jgi:hypothetical protein